MATKAKGAQKQRFIKAALDAECSEDESVFDRNLKQIAKVRQNPAEPHSRKRRRNAAKNVE